MTGPCRRDRCGHRPGSSKPAGSNARRMAPHETPGFETWRVDGPPSRHRYRGWSASWSTGSAQLKGRSLQAQRRLPTSATLSANSRARDTSRAGSDQLPRDLLAALSDERHGDPRKVTGFRKGCRSTPPGPVGACISENARASGNSYFHGHQRISGSRRQTKPFAARRGRPSRKQHGPPMWDNLHEEIRFATDSPVVSVTLPRFPFAKTDPPFATGDRGFESGSLQR
jgi:hypothetical protein